MPLLFITELKRTNTCQHEFDNGAFACPKYLVWGLGGLAQSATGFLLYLLRAMPLYCDRLAIYLTIVGDYTNLPHVRLCNECRVFVFISIRESVYCLSMLLQFNVMFSMVNFPWMRKKVSFPLSEIKLKQCSMEKAICLHLQTYSTLKISVPVNNYYSNIWRSWSSWQLVMLLALHRYLTRNLPWDKHLLITLANVP